MQMYHIFTMLVLLNGMDHLAKEYFIESLMNTFIFYHQSNFLMKVT